MKKALLIFLTLAILPISLGYKIGDINHDDSIDISDVVYLFKHSFRGEYVFNDVPGTGNQKIDSETLMERAVNADVVILRQRDYNIKTKEDLLKAYPTSGFENFRAFKNGRFYVSKPDYYRGELIDPIGTMEDYAKMIHPELFPNGDNDLKYFVKLQ